MNAMPVLELEPVVLPVLTSTHRELWDVLCDLADRHPGDWVLVGGQMVLLHALQAGRAPNRVSQDLDAVIDARVRPPVLIRFLDTLRGLGFVSAGVSLDDIAHRYEHGDIHIDVLVPEGVGRRAPIRTIGTAVTVEIAGGTQALSRRAAGRGARHTPCPRAASKFAGCDRGQGGRGGRRPPSTTPSR